MILGTSGRGNWFTVPSPYIVSVADCVLTKLRTVILLSLVIVAVKLPISEVKVFNPLSLRSKFEFSFLAPFISYRSSGEKKYQANSYCVIMSVILMTTLPYKALILQGEI